MTYESRETSMQLGEPLELYEFKYNDEVLRVTSAKSEVEYAGHTWEPAPLRRSAIEYTTDNGRNNLKLNAVRDFPIAELFRIMPPSTVILLTVYRVHAGDTDGAVIWAGRVLECDWANSIATLNCEPVSSSMQRIGLRRVYQRACPHVLYGGQCKVIKEDFAVPAEVEFIDGLSIYSTAISLFPDAHFSGGYIEVEINGQIERRFITRQFMGYLQINVPLPGLVVGDSLTVYAGCDHTLTTCHSKFDNSDNYGGMPYIPTKNPFNGSIY